MSAAGAVGEKTKQLAASMPAMTTLDMTRISIVAPILIDLLSARNPAIWLARFGQREISYLMFLSNL
jgi:hypothetical protein